MIACAGGSQRFLEVMAGAEWGVGLGWVSACAKGGDPRPVCPYLTGSTGYPPLVVWSHSRPDC